MPTETKSKAQVWQCPKCGWRYESPVRVSNITCSQRHNKIIMKLVEGEVAKSGRAKPLPVLRTIVVSKEDWIEPEIPRIKASLVSDPALLLEALGIQTNEGE